LASLDEKRGGKSSENCKACFLDKIDMIIRIFIDAFPAYLALWAR
jgi:hypothetical protein